MSAVLVGVVLCGGQSRRMGQPKAWLSFHGEPLLARVVRQLRPAVASVLVVAAPGQPLPPLPADVRTVFDTAEGEGPLRGLATGLAALDGPADGAFVCACDTPFIAPAFVQRLVQLQGAADACVPRVGDRPHPLSACYHRRVGPVAEQLLRSGNRRMTDLLAAVSVRWVSDADLADVGIASLTNLNTPEDVAASLQRGQ